MSRWRWLVAALGLLAAGLEAEARVGGGQSYSGGGSSGGGSSGGGSSGGGGEADLIFFLIRLCFHYPKVGIPLLSAVALWIYWNRNNERSLIHLFNGTSARRPLRPRRAPRAWPWKELQQHDPDFSRVILFDLLGRLFVRYQLLQGAGGGELEGLRPYLSDEVYRRLGSARERNERVQRALDDVVIGALQVQGLSVGADGAATLSLHVEYNFAAKPRDAERAHFFAADAWTLTRAAGARSPSPEQARALGCPSCGAPVDLADDGTCSYCETVIEAGKQSWQVTRVLQVRKQPRHMFNANLGGGVEEGTELPDVIAPDLVEAKQRFVQRHAGFEWTAFQGYARSVFQALQVAWSEQRWEQARPYETDQLFHTHRYYLDHQQAQGLVNQLREVQILGSPIVKVESDRYYDAITLRIRAKGLEFTTDRAGKVVSGSKTRPREFSEYWTFARAAGYQGREAQDAEHCPNCGAALEINMAGECAHCDSTITTGEFGWVLAAIEQDEAYAG